MTIGDVVLKNPLLLAPMAGVADLPFRLLCYEQGCALAYTEMVSAKSILYDNVNTKRLLDADMPGPVAGCSSRPGVQTVNGADLQPGLVVPNANTGIWNCSTMHPGYREPPRAVQLFGREPEIMAEAVRRLETDLSRPFAIVDINMGCPAPKVVKNGEGAALMNEPVLAGRIIESIVKATAKPVTVKIRKGFDDRNLNAVEIARIAEAGGAAAVTVHGRTREQFYSGTADYACIAAVKRALRIPVIGNGDVFTPQAAEQIQKQTGCDGVMVARGALGNPWLFAQILAAWRGEEPIPLPAWPTRMETALRHGRMAIAFKGERTGILEMRKHLSWYVKGLPAAATLRARINQADSYAAIEAILRSVL